MSQKVLILIILTICGIKLTESANCRYHEGKVAIFLREVLGYSCEISIENFDELESMKAVSGRHKSGRADGDVKILKKSLNMELTNFMFGFCQKFNNLETIDMSGVEIETIDENSLRKCQKLRQISLENNKIREVPENLLAESPKLTHLSFSSNELTSLDENVFSSQQKLEFLDLSYNKIGTLPANVFKPLSRLKILLLNKNKIRTLNPNLFVNLRNLQRLNLNNNRITDLPKSTFKSLIFLEKLGMAANYLTFINSDAFGQHDELTDVDISYNKIDAIDEKFIYNSAISSLDMRGNVCNQENLQHRSEVYDKLRNCFNKFRPRAEEKRACGKVKVGRQNIVNGVTVAQPGLFPWLALITDKEDGLFYCGGSLITTSKVVSVAHCIHDKFSKTKKLPDDISVQLGVYDFYDELDVNRITANVDEIFIHPDWNTESYVFDADISIIKLAKEIQFTNFIQPICLMEPDSEIAKITTGIVVGYGRSEDETKRHENIPKIMQAPIHENARCFLTNYQFAKFSSERTFCGGHGNGTSVCAGDTGFGLIVADKNTFYLRGIVSSSLINEKGCDVDEYAIFTNVLKYNDWIMSVK